MAAAARQQRSGSGRGISTPAAASLVAAAAAWRQLGISGCSTINNQLKAMAAMATEMATMIAMMSGGGSTWLQRGRIAAAAAALLQRSKSTRGGGGGNT